MTTRRRRVAFAVVYVGILLLATGLAIALVEAWASRQVHLPEADLMKDVRLNHRWPASWEGTHTEWIAANPDFPRPYVHKHNAQSWVEDYDVALAKAPGTYRIFYVGDSFTEGCVPMEESVPSRVEAHLNGKGARPGRRYEVINTGTWSYSPVLEYILIRYEIAPYAPDLIVLSVDMTDDFDDWSYRRTLVRDGEGNPYAVPPDDPYTRPWVSTESGAVKSTIGRRLQLFLFEHSYAYNLLRERARAREEWTKAVQDDIARQEREDGEATLYPRWGWCRQAWNPVTEEAVRFSMDTLGRIADFCRSRGIRLAVTAVPHWEQFARAPGQAPEWSSRPHEEVARTARAHGAVYFDSRTPLAPVVSGSEQGQYYYRGDMHFNPRGNALWAQVHIDAVDALLAHP